MKTPEDEAFDDLAKRQGAWGGGFEAKRKAAMDKINADFDEEYIKYRTAFPKREAALDKILQEQLRLGVYGSVPQPAQSTFDTHAAPGKALDTHSRAPQPAQEPAAMDDHQTLEALKYAASMGYRLRGTKFGPFTIKEASAQPAQEPVAWMDTLDVESWTPMVISHQEKTQGSMYAKRCKYPIYTTPPQRPWVGLTNDERKALERFTETCDDGEGYDVPKQMMQRLAQIGVVNHTSGGIYSTTEFGRWVIDAAPPKRERVVFPTMLRKMWSGGEVQAWLDENVNKEKNNG